MRSPDFEDGRVFQNDICTPKLNHYKECIAALIKISEIQENRQFQYRIDGTPFTATDWRTALSECIRLAKETLKGQP